MNSRHPRFPRQMIVAVAVLSLLGAIPTIAPAQAPTPEAKFQAAQRGISNTIAQLEAYLKENPNGKQAPVARVQLTALKSLVSSAAAVIPVHLSSGIPYVDREGAGTEWAIRSVVKDAEKTTVVLEVHNTRDNGISSFFAFDRNPLALVDNKGQFYAMNAVVTDAPAGVVKVRQGGNADNQHYCWSLQGGQTIQVTVEFEPLAPGATGGKILYKDNNQAEPAVFSLLNRRQVGK